MEVEGDKGLRGNRERGEESALSRFYFFFRLRHDVPVHRFDVSVHEVETFQILGNVSVLEKDVPIHGKKFSL